MRQRLHEVIGNLVNSLGGTRDLTFSPDAGLQYSAYTGRGGSSHRQQQALQAFGEPEPV